MLNETFLDDMNLPLANSREELSIISENLFKMLFDKKKFIIRMESERDKGIDFHIEIKNNDRFTNFRFAVQLKATDADKINNDKSISIQIATTNINYLLNNPMPAFYVLYYKPTNTFYYSSINDFIRSLYEKNGNWNNQETHVLRLSKVLDGNSVETDPI